MYSNIIINNNIIARKAIGQWLSDIQLMGSQINATCQIIPGELYQYNPLFLTEFSSFVDKENMEFPIIIDKMFDLKNINEAFSYINENDEHILGQNIGLKICNEIDHKCVNADNVNVFHLNDIKPYMDEFLIKKEKLKEEGYFQTSQSLKMFNL